MNALWREKAREPAVGWWARELAALLGTLGWGRGQREPSNPGRRRRGGALLRSALGQGGLGEGEPKGLGRSQPAVPPRAPGPSVGVLTGRGAGELSGPHPHSGDSWASPRLSQ